MGLFLTVSAVKALDPTEIAQLIEADFSARSIACRRLADGERNESPKTDIVIFEPRQGWSVVLWPEYFGECAHPFAKSLAGQDRVVSTVDVYDGDYWTHRALRGSALLHDFCSAPDYWEGEPREWNTDPTELAHTFGVEAAELQPYLVVSGSSRAGRAHPDDEFDLENIWVFVDFWRRLGIVYPQEMDKGVAVQSRLTTPGFLEKLWRAI